MPSAIADSWKNTTFALCFHGIRFKVNEKIGCRDDNLLFFI